MPLRLQAGSADVPAPNRRLSPASTTPVTYRLSPMRHRAMPAAADRGLLAAADRGNVLNPDHQVLAHGSERCLELIQAGPVSHCEEPIDLR